MSPKIVPMVHVADVRATVTWYESIGFTIQRTHHDDGLMTWALLTWGDTELMFNTGGRPSQEFRREVDLYVHVDSLDVIRSRISGRAEVVEDSHDTEYGMREFIVRDPNRFWITFGQLVSR